jgi:aryl-alcohol dehydrogenase-like predicted oxidoreductase
LLQHDGRILLIPGTSSIGHLEENLAAADLALDAEDLEALDEVRPAGSPREAVAHDD